MYSIVSLFRAVPDSDSSIISDPSGSECERLSVLHFNFLLHIFSFESIRTVHCFRVIREEGLGAPIQSGWRKGAPPLSTAAGEKARRAAPVHSGQRKGTPHRLCLQKPAKRRAAPPLRWRWWTTQATLESSVETVKAGSLPALLVKLIRFRVHDKENSSPRYYLPVLKVCNTVLCPLSNIYYFEFFLIVFSC